jgi:hypothetical protein
MGILTMFIRADASQAKKEIGETKRIIREISEQAAPWLGMGIGAGMFSEAMRKSVEHMKDLHVQSKRMDIPVETMQRLSYAADEVGLNVETVAGAFKHMRGAIAAGGISGLSQLGLDIKNLRGMNPEKQFEVIAKALEKVEDKSKRIKLMREIFGRSDWQSMMPLVNDYSNVMEEVKGKSILSESEVRSGHMAAKKVDDAKDWLSVNFNKGAALAIDLVRADARVISAPARIAASLGKGEFKEGASQAFGLPVEILRILGGIEAKMPHEDKGRHK